MKRFSIAIALILCLAFCVFSLASCGKKNNTASTTAGSTTASTTAPSGSSSTPEPTTAPVPTEPDCVHTPSDEYEIFIEPTCITPGKEAKFCIECGARIESTEREVPIDPDAHDVADWNTTPATMFADGLSTGHCSKCDQDVEVVLEWAPEIKVIDLGSAGSFAYGKENIVYEVLDGDHFYPTDEAINGKDLLVEYSILMNTSYENFKAGTNGADSPFANTRIANMEGAGYNDSVVWMSMRSNMPESFCQYIGGFESIAYGDINEGDTITPPGMCGSGTYSDYPNILGPDQANPEWGWHRVGVRIHEEVTNLEEVRTGETPIYKMSASTYIDGVLVSTLYKINPTSPAKLYTVESDGQGGLVYTDIDEDRYIYAFRIQEIAADDTVYLVLCDVNMTCGTEFVQNVTKVATPVAATLGVEDGVEIPAPVYYKLAD